MRKILSLIGILALSSTTILPVVACKTKDNGTPSSTRVIPVMTKSKNEHKKVVLLLKVY
ncbi:hypothetical protein [Spiroplasma endosymbiont of Nebria brevicollis]|uniref:hypothetical protein n=1 Tax=Spiroplasma endosymbiont of Nebria brevicollis TaxID=3066284 RepID=UPI00313E3247